MFKKAKQKIVIFIFAILCAVLVITLAMIYISSYLSVTSKNFEVLNERTDMLIEGYIRNQGNPEKDPVKEFDFNIGPTGQRKNMRRLQVETFYAVKLIEDGTGIVLDNGADGLYSNDELISLAKGVCEKEKGSVGELLYIVRNVEGETYVSFIDNTSFRESFTKLFIFSFSFGMMALVVITFISINIANRIVSPMEEMYEKQKQFTADAGHELKTPIAAVAANLELLKREIGENKWLENISYENGRMKELVTELLELARNENKNVEKKMTDLSRLVGGAILPLEASAFENNILIETDIADEIMASIEEKSVSQLVTILIDNAISHTLVEDGQTAKVSVSLSKKRGAAVLKVTNPGTEIKDEEKDKLFERFYRTDSSHEFTGHYGLGLAIAKAIADANGAKISVSCQDGQVTFEVLF